MTQRSRKSKRRRRKRKGRGNFAEKHKRFMKSDAWRELRAGWVERNYNHCRACRSTEDLHLHHLNYDRFGGKEYDEDLMMLCGECHRAVHRRHGKLKDVRIWTVTLAFVEEADEASVFLDAL